MGIVGGSRKKARRRAVAVASSDAVRSATQELVPAACNAENYSDYHLYMRTHTTDTVVGRCH